jgi:hypothetical protein
MLAFERMTLKQLVEVARDVVDSSRRLISLVRYIYVDCVLNNRDRRILMIRVTRSQTLRSP